MNDNAFRQFTRTLDALADDILRACRRAMRELAVMPWPSMLAFCVVLALIISILPLALFLFVLFLGLKVVAGAFIIERRRTNPHKE